MPTYDSISTTINSSQPNCSSNKKKVRGMAVMKALAACVAVICIVKVAQVTAKTMSKNIRINAHRRPMDPEHQPEHLRHYKKKKQNIVNQHPDLRKGPVIGIAAQRYDRDDPQSESYIASSYVKFIESAGGRVVPIPASWSLDQVRDLFPKLNGYLMPGGGAKMDTSGYYHHAKLMFQLAKDEFDKNGTVFPIYGICLGFEALMTITAGDDESILGTSDADDVSMALDFTADAIASDFLHDLSMETIQDMRSFNITYNHHQRCLNYDTWKKREDLNSFWKVLSVNADNSATRNVFVSTVESRHYPMYGTQWHPEKNAYEWADLNIDHSPQGIAMSQGLADFFVKKCRESVHRFPEEELQDFIIYNYNTEYVGKQGAAFQQFYWFQ